MKKQLLLLLCTVTMGLMSCKKETIIDSGLPNQTIETAINPSLWESVDGGERLTVTLPFPEIDAETFRNDGVLVYMYPNNDVDEYKPLPYVYNANSYTCTVRRGSITFDIQSSDNQDLIPVAPTIPIGVRIVLVTSTLD